MPSLRDLQASLSCAILAKEEAPEGRLAIYRNNTFHSLTEALKATFPVTVQLLDERFFRYLAHGFISEHPPGDPALAEYGRGLPGYIRRCEVCRDFPYLPDVARLEWAVSQAGIEAQPRSLGPSALNALAPELLCRSGLILQPSIRLALSRWPILDIWRAHQPGGEIGSLVLRRQVDRILVLRKGRGIVLQRLSRARFGLLHRLLLGSTLEVALSAIARFPEADATAELLAVFTEGLVTAVRPVRTH